MRSISATSPARSLPRSVQASRRGSKRFLGLGLVPGSPQGPGAAAQWRRTVSPGLGAGRLGSGPSSAIGKGQRRFVSLLKARCAAGFPPVLTYNSPLHRYKSFAKTPQARLHHLDMSKKERWYGQSVLWHCVAMACGSLCTGSSCESYSGDEE